MSTKISPGSTSKEMSLSTFEAAEVLRQVLDGDADRRGLDLREGIAGDVEALGMVT